MPKFNGPNKKRINPRYFLNETVEQENLEEEKEEVIEESSEGFCVNCRTGEKKSVDNPRANKHYGAKCRGFGFVYKKTEAEADDYLRNCD